MWPGDQHSKRETTSTIRNTFQLLEGQTPPSSPLLFFCLFVIVVVLSFFFLPQSTSGRPAGADAKPGSSADSQHCPGPQAMDACYTLTIQIKFRATGYTVQLGDNQWEGLRLGLLHLNPQTFAI